MRVDDNSLLKYSNESQLTYFALEERDERENLKIFYTFLLMEALDFLINH